MSQNPLLSASPGLPLSPSNRFQRTADALIRWQAVCGLALIGVTWWLWWPASGFPQIPWFAWGLIVPQWVEAVSCIALVGSLIGLSLALSPRLTSFLPSPAGRGARGERNAGDESSRKSVNALIVGVLASLTLLIVLDQHRLQPWAWQMLLWLIVFFASPPVMLARLRWLTVSIYFWSGVSKLDAAFAQPGSHGQLMIEGLASALGIDTRFWESSTISALTRIFPIGELGLAIWLAAWMVVAKWNVAKTDQPRWPSRMLRAGGVIAIGMHVILMLIVGPLGLDHELGVLVWNVFFIGQAMLLFMISHQPHADDTTFAPLSAPHPNPLPRNQTRTGPTAFQWGRGGKRSGQLSDTGLRDCVIIAMTFSAAIFPLGAFWGWCDHWPAWTVYSSRPEIVEVWIDSAAAEGLPGKLQSFLMPIPPLETRRQFSFDAWSYSELGCPIYPQDRYRLALAREFIARHQLTQDATIRIESSPDWWSGHRSVDEWNVAELDRRLERYSWNTRARKPW